MGLSISIYSIRYLPLFDELLFSPNFFCVLYMILRFDPPMPCQDGRFLVLLNRATFFCSCKVSILLPDPRAGRETAAAAAKGTST